MIRILIIEDEKPAARRLSGMVQQLLPDAEILGPLDSVESTLGWLHTNLSPDLVFMDIQLSDGLSFLIFQKTTLKCPVIFTTAFDEFALQAFRVSALDYLLKPIETHLLIQALERFKQRRFSYHLPDYQALLDPFSKTNQHEEPRFLLRKGDQYISLTASQIAYVYAEDKYVWIVRHEGERYLGEDTLEKLESKLPGNRFFRINRRYLVNFEAIVKIHTYFNSRLKIELKPSQKEEVVVSRDRVSDFKTWLNK
jgi:DNA-binding LytR/AlgR family response regulator